MKQASVAALKARLSEFLDAVKAGEEVIVTERGRPIARLEPVNAIEQADARIRWLIRTGLARPPKEKLPKNFWKLPRPADPEGRVLAALIEEREQGR